MRVKQHKDACNKGYTEKSAIAEHQWDQQHQVKWENTRVLDRAIRPIQLKVKEALHIQNTPANNYLHRDGGYELPGCWITTTKKLGGRVNSSWASANRVSALTSAPIPDRMRMQAQEPHLWIAIIFAPCFTFALRITRAPSRNVGKLYTEHQVVHKESSLFLYVVLMFMHYHFSIVGNMQTGKHECKHASASMWERNPISGLPRKTITPIQTV